MIGPIPLLDLASPSRMEYLHQLREAVHRIGVFNLVNYGPAVKVAPALLSVAAKFFALPESERLSVALEKSPHFRGYTGLGPGWADAGRSRRERLDLGVERVAPVTASGQPPHLLIEGPNQWPVALPSLRPVAVRWMELMERLARRLLADLLEALEAPADLLDPVLDRPHTHLKLQHYLGPDPATPANAEERVGDLGVDAHRDFSLITLLVQDDIGGLQVETGDGVFVDVTPMPDALVVNVGELLTGATGGYARAVLHRVVAPNPGEDRVSAPCFFGPRLDAVVPGVRSRFCDQPASTPADASYGDVIIKELFAGLPHIARQHHPAQFLALQLAHDGA